MRRNFYIVFTIFLLVAFCLLYFFCKEVSLSTDKVGANKHGSLLVTVLENYFIHINSHNNLKIYREHIFDKDPHMYDDEGKLVVQRQTGSAEKVEIYYYDHERRVREAYRSVCNEYVYENCTPLIISDTILSDPWLLEKILAALKSPCDYIKFAPKEEVHLLTDYCKSNDAILGKIILGLIDKQKKLTGIFFLIIPTGD